jgi:hypothetical protein
MKGTHKHMEASLKCFENHRCLSQSGESKFMCKDGAMWVLVKCHQVNWETGWEEEWSHVAPSLPCVHIHLLSSHWERHLWLSKLFSEASVGFYICLSSGDLFIFSVRAFHFFSYFFQYLICSCVPLTLINTNRDAVLHLDKYLDQHLVIKEF